MTTRRMLRFLTELKKVDAQNHMVFLLLAACLIYLTYKSNQLQPLRFSDARADVSERVLHSAPDTSSGKDKAD